MKMYDGKRRGRVVAGLLAAIALASTTVLGSPAAAGKPDKAPPPGGITLTILHNNDGESSLLPTTIDDVDYGGAALFKATVDALREGAGQASFDPGEARRRGVVVLNSGDNFLAGTTFEASRVDGAPFYDALAVNAIGYDALAIGNHEFDFGPATFARFVDEVDGVPFVSANLDVSGEPTLAALAGDRLVSSTVIRERGVKIGVVGLTTTALPTISSPGGVEVLTDLAGIAQAEIDALTADGVEIIVLVSHLQGLDSEIALAAELSGVDVVIGGGGDEVLADEDDELFPGNEDDIFGEYPQVAIAADGAEVPVVTTPGNYRYVGALQITFDKNGEVIGWDDDDSGLNLVSDQAVAPDAGLVASVEAPVADFLSDLQNQIVGTSEVALDCERSEVRGQETNCANLIADGLLSTGQALAADFGVAAPQIAIVNGGSIRGDIDQPVGPVSVADTFRLQPFGNFVSIAENVPAEAVRQIIEEGAIRLPVSGDGGFAHVGGATVVIDPSAQARVADQTTGVQTVPGERVRELVLDNGTVLVTGGVTQDVSVSLVGLNFSLGGGDAYPAVDFVTIGISDQQSLQRYIEEDLGGVITAAQYPVGGDGRLTFVPIP